MQIRSIQNKIHIIRDHRVMLDFDLAELYEVETRVLNQAVKRNIKRFPSDLSQIVTMSSQNVMTMKKNKLFKTKGKKSVLKINDIVSK